MRPTAWCSWSQGVIVEQNTAEAFFNDPQQPRTKEFLQTYKQRSLL